MSYDFECGTCNKIFSAGWQARDNHLHSTGHRAPRFECDHCARYFDSETARFQHMEAKNHFSWECSKCPETWPTEEQRINHEHDEHKYCRECERTFSNHNGMKMHLHSRVHCNYPIPCPFCEESHPMATSLSYHLESGSCPNASYMNRDSVYKVIRNLDPGGVITKNLISWPGSTQYEATDRSYNPERQVWECLLCHRPFQSLTSLNQHLNSPIQFVPLPQPAL